MSSINHFNYLSPRAAKARFGKILRPKPLRFLIMLLAIALLTAGVTFLILRNSSAWTCFGFAILPVALLYWRKYDLDRVPLSKSAAARPDETNITNLLSADCLTLLGPNPTIESIVKIIPKTQSGNFILTRFRLPPDFLAALLSTSVNSAENSATNGPSDPVENLFQTARRVRAKTLSEQISGGVLLLALIQNHPDPDSLLCPLQLEYSDLEEGIAWFNHLHSLVKLAGQPHRTGGIARDLSFGYIPLLQQFGTNLSVRQGNSRTQLHQPEHQAVLDQIIQTFSVSGRQNVALVGPYGSGRSTIVNAFAERLLDADAKLPDHLKFRQVFSLDVSTMISAAPGRSELESLVIRLMNEAFAAKNIILCLDNAHLFFEEGAGSIDLSSSLLPILEAGNLRMILIMDEQKFLEISARNSALANSFNKVVVPPTDERNTLKILEERVPMLEFQHHVIFTYRSLSEAYRLSERYIYDVAMPGRAFTLLESAAGSAEGQLVTEVSAQRAVEKTRGVKVQVADTAEDRSKLLNLEELIHERMVDQVGAVKAVSDSLRRAAAGVRNSGRPIGTFLFLGPTGVGKTELAKALSEVYFSGESKIIRLDLNEFVTADDVNRLIADGATEELSLTAQVMKNPFSVILLDEIEKAHPKVLTTLLQLLDEGILRDAKGREVSFRDAIVIATSNAGANRIRELIQAGENIDAHKAEFTDELISSNQFPPEFLNRFDEICLFKPLDKPDLLQIIDLILASTNRELEPRKIKVELDADAKDLLVEAGYDPALGARPMRRIVQKTVENLVARAVLDGSATPGATLHFTAADLRAQLSD